MAMMDRKCLRCPAKFRGGPRAFYCPECRVIRQRERAKKYRQNGYSRSLGSSDNCDRCGAEYNIEGGNQRFCPTCQPLHAAEHDRKTALAFYHANKKRINPKRYKLRRRMRYNLTGREFGRLKVIERDPGNTTRWICACKCGELTSVEYRNLVTKTTQSCGCLSSEWGKRLGAGKGGDYTTARLLNQRLRSNSTTGVKGVSIQRIGGQDRYKAYITTKGVTTYLGLFDTLEEAAEARKAAEEKYHKPLLGK